METQLVTNASPARPRLRAWASTLLVALLVASGLSLGAGAASAAPGDVAGATLDWGIKQSFRSYITGPIAQGSWTVSGSVTDATPFSWTGGAGTADQAGATGLVGYDGGIHFTGHGGVLDLTFSNVRIQQISATAANLILDTATATNVVFATVDLAAATPTSDAATVAYANAPATLTADGAASFAGFYSAGTALDPVSFSWPVEQAPEPPVPSVPTITVSKTSDLNPLGEVVTVTGTGFAPSAPATNGTRPPLAGKFGGTYVVFGKFADVWKPSVAAPSSARKVASQLWVVNPEDAPALGAAAVPINADGSFSLQLTVSRGFTGEPATGNYGIYTYGGSGANYAPFETATPIAFAPATGTTLALSAAPATGLVEGDTVTLTATVSPPAPGTLTFREGTTVLGTSTAATLQLAPLTPGSHTYTADFAPQNPLLSAASSTTLILDVAAKQIAAGSLTWGVKSSFREYVTGGIARGSITTSGVGTSGGAFVFGQASGGSFDAASGVGTSNYSGSVRFQGHDGLLDVTLSNPVIRVDSASSATLLVRVDGGGLTAFATLNLSAGTRSTPGNTVAYSAVPAALTEAGADVFSFGGSRFYSPGTALDPVSFVIGSAGGASGGTQVIAAFAGERVPDAAPPATTGITLDEKSLADLEEGSEITVTAEGFQPNEEGILIVIYSTPVILARNVQADAAGVVTWTGRLPAGLTGTHTLTMQGSVDRGVVLDIPARITTAAEGCPVDGSTLTWGFKESFRSYISGSIANGQWTVADGATYVTPDFGWTAGKGAYDAGKAGLVAFEGSITFTGHGGILNTTVSNPQLRFLDDGSAVLLLDVSGTTQEGAAVEQKAVQFVDLDLGSATVEESDHTVTVTGAPAVLTASGAEAFGTYEAGEAFDPVSFTLQLDPSCAVVEQPTTTAEPASTSSDTGWVAWLIAAIIAILVAALVVYLVLRRRAASSR